MIKYKCLVLDHDDTTVRSTPDIHYPQWLETLALMRPDVEMDIETFMRYNFELGFFEMCRSVLHFTEEEKAEQYVLWKKYTETHNASFYEGMPELIRDFREQGGVVCVASHSCDRNIIADYMKTMGDFLPDKIYAADLGEDKMKPAPYALYDIMEKYGFSAYEILMVDDLKAGYDMAKTAGVDFACAGWSHFVEEISDYMKNVCGDRYLSSVEQLRKILFEGE